MRLAAPGPAAGAMAPRQVLQPLYGGEGRKEGVGIGGWEGTTWIFVQGPQVSSYATAYAQTCS